MPGYEAPEFSRNYSPVSAYQQVDAVLRLASTQEAVVEGNGNGNAKKKRRRRIIWISIGVTCWFWRLRVG